MSNVLLPETVIHLSIQFSTPSTATIFGTTDLFQEVRHFLYFFSTVSRINLDSRNL